MENLFQATNKGMRSNCQRFYDCLNEKSGNDIYVQDKMLHLNVDEIQKESKLRLVEDETFIL